MKPKILIFFILLLAFLLRSFNVNSNPPSLYGDELTIGLDAYSLLKSGKDQLGNSFPLTFPMGAGRPAGYVYSSIPFIAIFGQSPIGVRMLSILSGVGIVLLLFLICRKIFTEQVGLITAVLGALSIWDISLSRGGFEAHFALFLALLGFYSFLLAKGKPYFYIFSALSFGLTIHTYPTYKITIPLFLILLIWYQGKFKELIRGKNYLFAGIIILIFLSIISLTQTFFGGSEQRFSNINVLSQGQLGERIEQKINYERSITVLPKIISKFFHNKKIEYAKIIGENYLRNFSVDFLFLHGDGNPRHNITNMGQFYLVDMFLIFTAILSLWQKKKKEISFLIFWILLSPIPTALVDQPHALRSSFMMPPLLILSGLGLHEILSRKSKLNLALIVFIFLIQFIFFTQKLFFLAPFEHASFWSYPARIASAISTENQSQYDYIILSDRIDNIEFAYPFYAKIDALSVIDQNKKRVALGEYNFKKFGNIYIGRIREDDVLRFINNLDGKVLYISLPDEQKNHEKYETINNTAGPTLLLIKKNPE